MSDRVSGIRRYFDQTAARFDGIYSAEKAWHQKVLDAAFRRTVNQRYELIMDDLKDMAGKAVLDVGTGSGRYAVELAARGASVTGIDFSSEMLELARIAAQQREVTDRCRWIQGDFLGVPDLGKRFDVSLAIGFFDYIANPEPILRRMAALTQGILYLSFPKRWTARTIPRKVRLAFSGCYVRFYTGDEIASLMQGLGKQPIAAEIISVNRDYLVKASFA